MAILIISFFFIVQGIPYLPNHTWILTPRN